MRAHIEQLVSRTRQRLKLAADNLSGRSEADRASSFWESLTDYHEQNDFDETGIGRSRWLATELIPGLGIESLLEVGTNSGRNLAALREHHPHMRLKGIDVNARAIDWARAHHPGIEFEHGDANHWTQPPDSFDAILTMSVLDHIPDDATEDLAENFARTATKYVIAVELWDGENATRGPFKYSRDTKALFERHRFETVRWEVAPGQYDTEHSLLWLYVGAPPRSSGSAKNND